ncbi:MAG: ATP-binding protein [Syntrophothermus sp.]|nr:ATP-binding protein [Ignavibacteriaceae bacterium]
MTPEQNFALYYENIHVPIQVINKDGKVVYVNPSFSFHWGYDIAELENYNIYKDPEVRRAGLQHIISRVFEDKSSCFVESYSDSLLKNKDVTTPIFRTKMFYISWNEQDFVVFEHEDDTEIVLIEEELKKARESSHEAERLKDTFLNVLSHELRTPLNIILGYSLIIKESLKDKLNSEEKVYIDNLYSGSERLFKSIAQMLEFAHIEAGDFRVKVEKINIIPVLKNCIDAVYNQALEKNLDIKTRFNVNPLMVEVDLQCIENAVNNLLLNAIKFTQQGFIEVEVDVLSDKDLMVCKIKDSGIGISSQYMDHLFTPFSQEDLNISRNYEGNGLGLALAKRYIEKLGGSIIADSIKGVGTTFTFTLPFTANKTITTRKKNILPLFKKVLMIDETNSSYGLLNAFLKSHYEIDIYDFRKFNLELLLKEEYNLILIDVHQSHWDQSIIICKDIKRLDKYNRPIIILSSEFQEEKINKFLNAGADKFVVKPFSKDDILETLNAFNLANAEQA